MSHVRRKNGKYQARLTVKGKSLTATFATREAAEAWALITRQELMLGRHADVQRARQHTFGQLLDRYADTITPTKHGQRQELLRIRMLRSLPIADGIIGELTTMDFAALRDELSQGRKPNTVRLYLSVCQQVFRIAISEWGFSTMSNPLAGLRKPKVDDARDRRVSAAELKLIAAAIQELRAPWFKWLFFFVILCPQRRREILDTKWSDVDFDLRRLRIGRGKDGKPRYAPLSPDAMALLEHMPRSEDGRLFPLSGNAVSMCWKGILKKTGITNLHWHDLRHEGASRYALILGKDIFKLKVVTGHKDIRSMSRYVNHSAEDVAFELAGGLPPAPPPLPLDEVLFEGTRPSREHLTPPLDAPLERRTATVLPFRPPARGTQG